MQETLENFDSKKIFNQKLKKIAIALLGFIVTLCLLWLLFSHKDKGLDLAADSTAITLDAGTAATNTDKMWRQHVEDTQQNLENNLSKQISQVADEFKQKTDELESKKDQEIRFLREKMQFLQAEIEEKKQQTPQIMEETLNPIKISRHQVNLNNNKNSKDYEALKTADNYIPAGTIIKAATLNGLRSSTAVHTSSNPDEIVIELLDYGILPNDFRNNVKSCRVIGDAYGDLSSETVKVRTSKLSCIEVKTGESIETDLVGMIVGSDGYAGIRGTVVSVDQKYLANATIFGIMSGLAGVGVKDSTSYNAFTIGTGVAKPMTDTQKASNNLLNGTSNSLDKLSDYYIAHAERISPVIEIDAGRKITIAVLKGTYFGNSTLKKAMSNSRETQIKKTAEHESNNLLDDMEIK